MAVNQEFDQHKNNWYRSREKGVQKLLVSQGTAEEKDEEHYRSIQKFCNICCCIIPADGYVPCPWIIRSIRQLMSV